MEYLKECLHLKGDCGTLIWNKRPESHFSSATYADRWNSRFAGEIAINTISQRGYKVGQIGRTNLLAHRCVWALKYGYWPKSMIDHINRDKSDNRICNLRPADALLNRLNRGVERRNKSGHTGIYWNKHGKKWHAQIKRGQLRIHLGMFDSLDDAVEARRLAEKTV